MSIILLNDGITRKQRALAEDAERLDIATYSYGTAVYDLLIHKRPIRLLFGAFTEEDVRRVMSFAAGIGWRRWKHVEMRVRWSSHVKLFLAYLPRPVAIVGSANIGSSGAFECSVVVEGKPTRALQTFFEGLWQGARPIKPLDLESARVVLSTGVFEDRRESNRPATATATANRKED